MSANHTPEPWVYRPCPAELNGEILGKGGQLVAKVWSGRACSQEVADTNGRLLAAAPETAAERDRLKILNAELIDALKKLRKELFAHYKPDVRKHFSLLVADAAAGKVVHKAESMK